MAAFCDVTRVGSILRRKTRNNFRSKGIEPDFFYTYGARVRTYPRIRLVSVSPITESLRKILSAPCTILFGLDLFLVLFSAVNCIDLCLAVIKLDSHFISADTLRLDPQRDRVAEFGL